MNGIKPIPKRTPGSKSGRLLCSILRRKILIASNDYVKDGAASQKDIDEINKLIDRIQLRLSNESKKLFPQSVLFQNYCITFIRPKRKRKQTISIVASNRRQAIKIVREKYGHKTKIV